MTDFYVAGRVRNAENILRLIHDIEAKGYSCYNFLSKPCTPESKDLPWDEQMDILESHTDFLNDPNHQRHFKEDLEALKNTHTVVLLLPAGIASHIEAGIAFGLGKKLVLIGEVEKPETLYLMFDERYQDMESFIATI